MDNTCTPVVFEMLKAFISAVYDMFAFISSISLLTYKIT